MKFKIIIFNFLFIAILSNSISDEIFFESSNLNILEDGNIIKDIYLDVKSYKASNAVCASAYLAVASFSFAVLAEALSIIASASAKRSLEAS